MITHALVIVLAQVETNFAEERPPEQAPPAAEVAPADRPPVPPKPMPPVSVRLDGAYAPRKLFTIPVTGADVGLGIGAQPSEHAAFWGSTRVLVAGTENGLKVWDVRVLGEGEYVAFDRLRLGAGLGVFVLGVGRAARSETILSWGPVAQAMARVDVVREDDFGIFLRAALSGGYDVYDSSAFWGPSLGAGFELDVAGKRRR